jgi:hypothetical protein
MVKTVFFLFPLLVNTFWLLLLPGNPRFFFNLIVVNPYVTWPVLFSNLVPGSDVISPVKFRRFTVSTHAIRIIKFKPGL